MDRTEHFRGRLMDGNQVLLDSVEGHLRTRPRPGGAIGEWTGTFEYPPELKEMLAAGHRFRLVLIDGRSANVHVHLTENDPFGRLMANFHGAGSLKR